MPIIIGFAITIASCSTSSSGSSPTSAVASSSGSVAAATAPAPTTSAAPATTSAAPATTVAPTTTTVATKPISHGELWDLIDGPALLTAADGTTMHASFGGALPIRGQANGVDLDAAAATAKIQGDVSFQADRNRATNYRSVQMWLAATPEGAAALLAAAGPQFGESQNPTPLTTTIEGAMAFEYNSASDQRAVQLSFARGPVFVVVDIYPWAGEATDVNLAVAETIARSVVARIDKRLPTCGSPCTGVAGGAPKWPNSGPDVKRPVGTCEVYNGATPDFRPPATYRSDVPCSEVHDVEYVSSFVFPDVALLPRAGMLRDEITAEMDQAAFKVLYACLDATKATRDARGLTVTYSQSVAPTPEQIAAGDQEVVCTLDDDVANLDRIPGVPA